ncbi:MAG: ORF6N domain-containing protein [Elusimicrobia bacterium]|nr:ORF6N domain-containing protein [Elusimicrobiota bacterium]
MKSLIPIEHIQQRIYLIRGHKVMLDEDLAKVYGVTTKRLNQQVNRNRKRFPGDFMFQVTRQEAESLRLQNATLDKSGRGRHRKYLPYAFTEYGAVMVSSVLNTPIAIEASVLIARAFVKLRELLSTHKALAKKIEELEKHVGTHDQQILNIFERIRALMTPSLPPPEPKRRIGYQTHVKSRGSL